MLTKNIKFENFSKKKNYSFIQRELKKLLGDRLKKDNLLNTLTNRYNYSFKTGFKPERAMQICPCF